VRRFDPIIPQPVEEQAGQIVVDAMREAGIDPGREERTPEVTRLWQEWVAGVRTRAEFIAACRAKAVSDGW
jgi:hypothetical protein